MTTNWEYARWSLTVSLLLWSFGQVPVLSLPPYCRHRTKKKVPPKQHFFAILGLCEEDIVYLGGCLLIHGRGAVGVDIHGGGDVGMADASLDSFEVDTGFYHHGSTAMAKVMEADVL